MVDLLDVTVDVPSRYLLLAALAAAAVRIVTGLLKALQAAAGEGAAGYVRALPGHFLRALGGVGPRAAGGAGADGPDYLAPLVLGVVELLAYPVLMVASSWTTIGMWLILKTAVSFRRLAGDPHAAGRFLIENGLILILSYWMLTRYVSILPLDEGEFLPALARSGR